MIKTCKVSGKQFEITEDDLKFYEKMGVPTPTLCSEERQRRRLVWRNERCLYHRTCDATGKKIISLYSSSIPFPVYENDYWWSDNWDAKDYGLDFDFSKTFFEQFKKLRNKIPHFALNIVKPSMQNSEFCNQSGYVKDCYLIVNAYDSEKCFYGKGIYSSFDCVDCLKIINCEGCYETINSENCSFCTYLWDSKNSSDCHYSANLIGCKNCFGCVNLRNKEYYFLNEPLSKEKWQEKVKEVTTNNSPQELLTNFQKFRSKFFVKWMEETNSENCTGNLLSNCKNCKNCFDCENTENSKYCWDLTKGDSVNYENYDISFFGINTVSCYECTTIGYNANKNFFSVDCIDCFDTYYSDLCAKGTKHVFGCVGLKKAQYCILNKQYTKEEYFALREKIIAHMKKTGEWGEFFPIELSPFAYNETVAQEYFSLTKEEVLSRDWKWKDDEISNKYTGEKYEIPDTIAETTDDILQAILECEECGKNYRLVKPELKFYRKMNLPVPHKCPNCRHKDRMALRNPRRLYDRKCDNCDKEIQTTFAPDRPEKVFCEDCYLKAIN